MDQFIYQKEDFSLDQKELILEETIFHNANGYLGVRANFEEGYPDTYKTIRGTYINGVYDFTPMNQAEKLHGLIEEKQTILNVADTQEILLYIEGQRFSMFEGTVLGSNRILDMKKGITIRNIIWESDKGHRIEIKITRMASFVFQHLFLINYEMRPLNFDGEIEIVSAHKGKVSNFFDPSDPRVAGETFEYLHLSDVKVEDDISIMTAETSKSGIQICSLVKNQLESTVGRFVQKETEVTQTFTVRAQKGKKISFYKYTVLGDSIRSADVQKEMKQYLKDVVSRPVFELYERQEVYLKDFWNNSALEVEGDEDLQKAVYYNQYQLLSSVSKDAYGNIAAKGLSGEGYEGHYFWDTEMYLQPFFVLNEREISKNLIRFRYRTLEFAKDNARELGHSQGALYPWRTIMGKECSGYFPSGTAAYHINGDVAYSVVAYYLATKDLEFMKECGAEILLETARLWMDAGNYYQGKFHINEVTGPDEYTCMVNNNYYTNLLAQYNLRWAAKMVRILSTAETGEQWCAKMHITEEECRSFEEAADNMMLPYDEETGINPQDDSFMQKKRWDLEKTPSEMFPLLMNCHPLNLYRYQICKQADTVMAHFILEDAQDIDTIRRSYDYYEKITTHDSSLSTCIFSIMAARLGMTQKAYDYFGESAKLDLFNTHKNTKDGIHTANMGGTYMAIVYGFGGFRLKEEGISFRPVMPKAWNGYSFKILFEDSKILVRVDKKQCEFILENGSGKEISVYDEKYFLVRNLAVSLKENNAE
ncbi:MAG: glycoside hydrolase family 65 protein [Lachnospiraceae bacterium]|nr:glycoside hydrolase family 65 protein [Lachnospiraceae bacterium]